MKHLIIQYAPDYVFRWLVSMRDFLYMDLRVAGYVLVPLLPLLCWFIYRVVKERKAIVGSSPMFIFERELGRKEDGEWRRHRLRAYGALKQKRRHHHRRHKHSLVLATL